MDLTDTLNYDISLWQILNKLYSHNDTYPINTAGILTCLSQVDGQHNRTGSSPGPLVGLSVFNQLFVGGYNEYTPELLPLGSRFRHGFQGKTATASLQPDKASVE